jgi:glycosyltransferase involved in cell wall biosynthesis
VHICHVIDNMFLDQGGPVAVVHGLARAQVAAGDRVSVVCRRQLRPAEPVQPEHDLGGADLREIDTLRDGSAKARLWQTLSQLSPDVLHLHAVWEPIQRHAATWAKRHRVPWVLSSHGMLHPVPMRKGWLKKRVYLWLLGGAVTGACRILVVNDEESQLVRHAFGVAAEVIPNGFDFDPETKPEFSLTTAAEGAILFIGRLHALKGIQGLVRSYALAVRAGLDCPLVLIGPDEGELESILQVAQDAGVHDRVRSLGPIYGHAKRDALRHCRMLVHRPRYEGFGMTIVEAMAAARPVITTTRAGIARQCPPEILKLAPDTDDGFAKAMLEVWQDSSKASAMGSRAYAWVKSHLPWPVIAARIRTSYLAK